VFNVLISRIFITIIQQSITKPQSYIRDGAMRTANNGGRSKKY